MEEKGENNDLVVDIDNNPFKKVRCNRNSLHYSDEWVYSTGRRTHKMTVTQSLEFGDNNQSQLTCYCFRLSSGSQLEYLPIFSTLSNQAVTVLLLEKKYRV